MENRYFIHELKLVYKLFLHFLLKSNLFNLNIFFIDI